jgi:hypothetical protein
MDFGTLCQEGPQAQGDHCSLQWHRGICYKRGIKHKEIIALYNGIKVFVMRGASCTRRSLLSTMVSRYLLYNDLRTLNQEGQQAQGDHCSLQWYQGICYTMILGLLIKRDLKHKEINALYNAIKVFVIQ